jgi:hypothetical protein
LIVGAALPSLRAAIELRSTVVGWPSDPQVVRAARPKPGEFN